MTRLLIGSIPGAPKNSLHHSQSGIIGSMSAGIYKYYQSNIRDRLHRPTDPGPVGRRHYRGERSRHACLEKGPLQPMPAPEYAFTKVPSSRGAFDQRRMGEVPVSKNRNGGIVGALGFQY